MLRLYIQKFKKIYDSRCQIIVTNANLTKSCLIEKMYKPAHKELLKFQKSRASWSCQAANFFRR